MATAFGRQAQEKIVVDYSAGLYDSCKKRGGFYMNKLVRRIEQQIEKWWRSVPHLPKNGQRWLAENVWWIALVGAIMSAVSVLVLLNSLRYLISPVSYYGYVLTSSYTGWAIFTTIVSLVFVIITGLLLAFAVKPLRAVEKKGWTLLFMVSLVEAVNIVLNAVLSLSIFGFIIEVIFGAIGVAIGLYFLFEIRDHFAHILPKNTQK
jgi:hypothetical protein